MLEKRWHEDRVDSQLFMELQNLARVLARQKDLQFEFSYGSFIDLDRQRLTVSSLWETTEKKFRRSGYKTDLYLRSIGTLYQSDAQALLNFERENHDKFAKQVASLLEDLRLEEIIKRQRPGTIQDFNLRRHYLRNYFTSQLTTNMVRKQPAEALFSMIYLTLSASSPEVSFPEDLSREKLLLEKIKPFLFESFEAQTTIDILDLTRKMVILLGDEFPAMRQVYFSFPLVTVREEFKESRIMDELSRTDDVENEDAGELDGEDSDYTEETLSTWHQEQKPEEDQTFLQMDLELGTKTNLRGKTARETESGDQAFVSIQASSRKSAQQDYTSKSILEEESKGAGLKRENSAYGKANLYALPIFKDAVQPSSNDWAAYEELSRTIGAEKRILIESIQKILEHKQDHSRDQLVFGRLSKNLLPVLTEDFPKLFYKKDHESKEFDTALTLMVDCSASMDNKMTETKRGIILFHEVLKELKIPHSIVGFWEGVTSSLRKEQPNYFHRIHDFSDSLYEKQGAKILQLAAEEDNRDGYSIRKMTEELLKRREKDKFLLVFTDGEPAAKDYYETGIVDTNEAVSQARKLGIHVLGIFLANQPIADQEREMMRSIYDRNHLMIENLAQIPERLRTILKKMLTKSL